MLRYMEEEEYARKWGMECREWFMHESCTSPLDTGAKLHRVILVCPDKTDRWDKEDQF